MKKQVHIYYEGRVQGVGFRYTTQYLAQQLNVTGWVKNLFDGRVELLAEGTEEELRQLLGQMKARLGSYIWNEHVDWSPYTGEFRNFGIRF